MPRGGARPNSGPKPDDGPLVDPVRVLVLVPSELLSRIDTAANGEGVSRSAWIRKAMRNRVQIGDR